MIKWMSCIWNPSKSSHDFCISLSLRENTAKKYTAKVLQNMAKPLPCAPHGKKRHGKEPLPCAFLRERNDGKETGGKKREMTGKKREMDLCRVLFKMAHGNAIFVVFLALLHTAKVSRQNDADMLLRVGKVGGRGWCAREKGLCL
jgi:hypothetical protein